MLLTEVVTASAELAATRSRKAKIATLAAVLRAAGELELPAVIAFLTGQLPQGRIGTGWRTLAAVDAAPAAEPSLTVSEVDTAFDTVGAVSGSGSVKLRAETLRALLVKMTKEEQEFLFRLISGELRQGALEGIMVDAVASAAAVTGEQARRAFMLSGSLPDTAVAALTGGADALAAFRLQLGRPIRPMLASPAENLAAALDELGRQVSVEYKLDGARIQVHRDGDAVHVYTRTLREITGSVPELVELIAGLPCRSVVLDGETLALADDGRPRPFQETMSRFGAASPRELLLRPYFFDCLHLDGIDLLDEPLTKRRAALDRVAGEHVIPSVAQPAAGQPDELLASALAAGHEGIMVKDLGSVYAAGRRGRAWQKVKPVHTVT